MPPPPGSAGSPIKAAHAISPLAPADDASRQPPGQLNGTAEGHQLPLPPSRIPRPTWQSAASGQQESAGSAPAPSESDAAAGGQLLPPPPQPEGLAPLMGLAPGSSQSRIPRSGVSAFGAASGLPPRPAAFVPQPQGSSAEQQQPGSATSSAAAAASAAGPFHPGAAALHRFGSGASEASSAAAPPSSMGGLPGLAPPPALGMAMPHRGAGMLSAASVGSGERHAFRPVCPSQGARSCCVGVTSICRDIGGLRHPVAVVNIQANSRTIGHCCEFEGTLPLPSNSQTKGWPPLRSCLAPGLPPSCLVPPLGSAPAAPCPPRPVAAASARHARRLLPAAQSPTASWLSRAGPLFSSPT